MTNGEDRRGCGCVPRLMIALVIAAISLISYFMNTQTNPVTGEKQRVGITVDQEVALGLQAVPEMEQMHGGQSPNQRNQALVDEVGQQLVAKSPAAGGPYKFEFHLLRDDQTVNAFALPGGQVFITEALLSRLKTRGQLAGVLGHEVGHVIERHGAEHMAKAQLTQGLTGAAVIATMDPDNPKSMGSAQLAMLVGQMVNMKWGRDDELESDRTGVKYMAAAGYDPRALIEVMKILKEAGGGRGAPEFFSTHPNPDNRVQKIEAAIKDVFPNGVPSGLTP